jgi:hypothetical protein
MCALWGPGAVHACCDVILYDNACIVTTWVLLGYYWVRYWVLLVVTTWVLLGPLLGTGSYYLGTTGSVTGYYW